jgi:hypothetical protein
MAKKKAGETSPNILDYPDTMSEYEKESLAAGSTTRRGENNKETTQVSR